MENNKPHVCGLPCEVYSRVVGYLRPVQQWNEGKQAEYTQRLPYRTINPEDPVEMAKINERIAKRFGNF